MPSNGKAAGGFYHDKASLMSCPKNASNKKRKRPSPFRIKAGCVVALRYQPNGRGNHVTMIVPPSANDTTEIASENKAVVTAKKPTKQALRCLVGTEGYTEVWTDPVPGRDEGLALIGRRIRCFFTRPMKVSISNNASNSDTINSGNGASTAAGLDSTETVTKSKKYIAEGEIVSIPNYGTAKWKSERTKQKQRLQGNKIGGFIPWFEAELLIHRDLLATTPFLQRTDEDVDVNSLKKESTKRAYRNEELIKGGSHLVTVRVRLVHPSCDNRINGTGAISKERQKELRKYPVAKWAIRKRIPNNPGYPWEDPTRVRMDSKKQSEKVLSTKSKSDTEITAKIAAKKTKIGTTTTTNDGNENLSKKNDTGSLSEQQEGAEQKIDANVLTDRESVKKIKVNSNGTAASKKQKSGPIQYMGNGDDDAAAQQNNWRWFAARYFDYCLSNSAHVVTSPAAKSGGGDMVQLTEATICNRARIPSFYEYYSELLSSCGGGLVGEVLEVIPSLKPGTLAMVTIRRLVLAQHTANKSIFNIDLLEVLDDYDSLLTGRTKPNLENSNQGSQDVINSVVFRVPIEELVIVSQRITRVFQNQESVFGSSGEYGTEELFVKSSYSWRGDCLVSLKNMILKNSDGSPPVPRALTKKRLGKMSICHGCRTWFPHAAVQTCYNANCPLKPNNPLHLRGQNGDEDTHRSLAWCHVCQTTLLLVDKTEHQNVESNAGSFISQKLPCCLNLCDCWRCKSVACLKRVEKQLLQHVVHASAEINDSNGDSSEDKALAFSDSVLFVKSIPEEEFNLPSGLIDLRLLPHLGNKVISKTKAPVSTRTAKKINLVTSISEPSVAKVEKRKRESTSPTKKTPKRARATSPRPRTLPPKPLIPLPHRVCRRTSEDYTVFKPTCSRLLDYDTSKVLCKGNSDDEERQTLGEMTSGDKPRNLRELQLKNSPLLTIEKDEKVTSSRALRASQRRLAKGVSSLGSSTLNFDTLVGRESQLRFDRSAIHAWGVFADGEISSGDMIVEYRGELIGNAMAEKREREYELAKIGSDYMFRIDNLTVCDATKQGNVARFINASCDPNCYTKIITLDGRQRIVIYAKKDIKVGEELCYDYKFALEYDESQRIPCHCGAQECRGFMNWDKRYVTIPPKLVKNGTTAERLKQSNEAGPQRPG